MTRRSWTGDGPLAQIWALNNPTEALFVALLKTGYAHTEPLPRRAAGGTTRAMAGVHHLKIKLQVMCGDEIAMGPGKADLLEAIGREGSISAAARALGFSYRRAWLLVDAMNRCWREPLVLARGGSAGAQVTPLGAQVLAQYRQLQGTVEQGSGSAWAQLEAGLLAAPRLHQT
jgi:molybdate transport system regulatory protein